MALTEQQEKDLLAAAEASKAAIDALKAQNDKLAQDAAAKAAELTALKTQTDKHTQDAAAARLKAQFPDVPLETLLAMPEASREAQGKLLQETMGKLKTPPAGFKTGAEAFGSVGGIGTAAEVEDAAALAQREKARHDAVQKGDLMGVLRVKSRDTVEWLQKNFVPSR